MIFVESEIKFKKIMEDLALKYDANIIFSNFLDYYICKNSNNLTMSNEFNEEGLEKFGHAYKEFLKFMPEKIKKNGWYDFLGDYFEEFVIGGSRKTKGQFYTPPQVSELLTEIAKHPTKVMVDENTAYDSTCGSSRNLLSYHSIHPGVQLHGQDIDNLACRMSVVNYHIHGVSRGQVDWMNSLENNYFGISWVIFPDQIIVTDLDEIRTIHKLTDAVEMIRTLSIKKENEKMRENGKIKEAPVMSNNLFHTTEKESEVQEKGKQLILDVFKECAERDD